MASLHYRDKSGAAYSLSGSAYTNDIDGTRKLYLRTGTEPDAKETYGVATATSVFEYSPLKMKVDNSIVGIGRKETHYTYSTNTNSLADNYRQFNTEADPILTPNLTRTVSEPYSEHFIYDEYINGVSPATAWSGYEYNPNYPNPGASRSSSSIYGDGNIKDLRSMTTGQHYSETHYQEAYTDTSYYNQYTNGSGESYWSGAKTGWTLQDVRYNTGGLGTKWFDMRDAFYNYSWSMSTKAYYNWYFWGSSIKYHDNTGGSPASKIGSEQYEFTARMTDWWSRDTINDERASTYYRTMQREFFSINYVGGDRQGRYTNILVTTQMQYTYYTSTSSFQTSRQTYKEIPHSEYYEEHSAVEWINTIIATTTTWGPHYSLTVSTEPIYSYQSQKSYVATTYSDFITDRQTYTQAEYQNIVRDNDYHLTRYIGHYYKDISATYTTESRTITTVNNSNYTIADKTVSQITHNFI